MTAKAARAKLPQDPEALTEMLVEALTSIEKLTADLTRTRARLDYVLRMRFGPRAERVNPNQLRLFDDPPAEEETVATPTPDDAEAPPKSKRRRRRGRRKLPANLPVVQVTHDVPPHERCCPDCGTERARIGDERSRQLEYEPAKLYVVEHVREKLACPCCEANVQVADKPAQPIEKGLPGPGLLAQVITAKIDDHLPLHRQEKIFKRHGIIIGKSTMCAWLRAAAGVLVNITRTMTLEILKSKYLAGDDTPVPLIVAGNGKTKRGHMWAYLGDERHPYTVYHFTVSRSRDGPQEFLDGFTGQYFQADACPVFNCLFVDGKVLEVGCWAHARRKFFDAQGTDSARALYMLAQIRRLYVIESDAKGFDADARRALRQEKALPILHDIHAWLQDHAKQVLPESPIAKAIGYALNHWDALVRYTEDGELRIDNNASENALRGIAVGRKNWLFLGSEESGHVMAVLYTIVRSCHRNGVDPWAYLRDVLARLPSTPISQLPDLLPDRWTPQANLPAPPR